MDKDRFEKDGLGKTILYAIQNSDRSKDEWGITCKEMNDYIRDVLKIGVSTVTIRKRRNEMVDEKLIKKMEFTRKLTYFDLTEEGLELYRNLDFNSPLFKPRE